MIEAPGEHLWIEEGEAAALWAVAAAEGLKLKYNK